MTIANGAPIITDAVDASATETNFAKNSIASGQKYATENTKSADNISGEIAINRIASFNLSTLVIQIAFFVNVL